MHWPDKDPKGFFLWLESMGGFVRSTDGGQELEDMLDSKLHSVYRVPSRRPAAAGVKHGHLVHPK